jgi:SHS2 domain-containing protein
MNCFRLLEHTADMGIAAQGDTLVALYVQAALGLRQILTACTDIRPEVECLVEVRGEDREELMVNWLSELLFLLESKRLLPAAFEIDNIELDTGEIETGEMNSLGDCRLRARVFGETFDPERHYLDREIKAVTYHRIEVEPTATGWRAQVYVDL